MSAIGALRAATCCGVAVAALVCGAAAPAGAERPVVDIALLPEPAPPAPPEPTEQRNACVPVSPTADGPAVPAEFATLDFGSVWPITRGAGQVVAVIDTGVSPHPRLPGLRPGGDYVYTGDGLSDCDAHGTLVAGLIAGSPVQGSGFAGGAPDAQILSIRQSSNAFARERREDDEEDRSTPGNSSGYGDVMTMARAVRTAADLGATVINISEVACVPGGTGVADGPLGAAVEYASTVKDVVIVAAAGNTGGGAGSQCPTQNPTSDPTAPMADPWDRISTIATPAWFDDRVLTVGSVGADGSTTGFTLAGPWVDVAAPGTSITSLSPTGVGLTNGTIDNQGGTVPIQGTSFSAPLVSAVAALVRANRPELSAAQVIERIEATAHAPAEGWNPFVGHGVVDPLAAVTATIDPRDRPLTETTVIAAPAVPEPPDTGPRTVAVTGTLAVTIATVLGLGISIPLRRRRPAHSVGSAAASGSGPTPS